MPLYAQEPFSEDDIESRPILCCQSLSLWAFGWHRLVCQVWQGMFLVQPYGTLNWRTPGMLRSCAEDQGSSLPADKHSNLTHW